MSFYLLESWICEIGFKIGIQIKSPWEATIPTFFCPRPSDGFDYNL